MIPLSVPQGPLAAPFPCRGRQGCIGEGLELLLIRRILVQTLLERIQIEQVRGDHLVQQAEPSGIAFGVPGAGI